MYVDMRWMDGWVGDWMMTCIDGGFFYSVHVVFKNSDTGSLSSEDHVIEVVEQVNTDIETYRDAYV